MYKKCNNNFPVTDIMTNRLYLKNKCVSNGFYSISDHCNIIWTHSYIPAWQTNVSIQIFKYFRITGTR